MDKIRVVFIGQLTDGGVERVITNLAVNMDRQRYNAAILSVCNEIEPDKIPSCVRDIHHVCLHQPDHKSAKDKILRTLSELQPHIICTCNMIDTDIALQYRKRAEKIRPRVIFTEHTVPSSIVRNSWRSRLIYGWYPRITHIFNKADCVICVSEGVRKDFEELYHPKAFLKVIYNPIAAHSSLKPYHAIRKDKPHIVAAGRLEAEKNFLLLVNAFALLHQRDRAAGLTIYGQGRHREALESQIRELHLEGRVHLPGYSSSLADELPRYDVLVSSSCYESFGNTLVEAMYAGISVAAADCPVGPREILKNGKHGVLTQQTPEALAEGIWKAVQAFDLHQYQLNAERARDFSIERSVEAYQDLFEELMRR